MTKTKTPKEKTLKVDKEFLTLILKQVAELRQEIKTLQEREIPQQLPPKVATPTADSLFYCQHIDFTEKPSTIMTIEEQTQHQNKMQEFQKKLENLMKEYRIGHCVAFVLKRL